ncbi:MAG: rhomboid family intramembrane serine protease [Candidatus Riflebacteria bacterium]|nr:rhomboid family intramembrane serine protease [Candidatus Riflebacteria bacterium]
MDLASRLILYILIANVGYMVFSLCRRGVRPFGGYILQLVTLLGAMVALVARGESGFWAVTLSLAGVFILVGIPLLLQKQIERLISEQRFAEIEPLARWKALLAWSELNSHLEAIARIVAGSPEIGIQAVEALKGLLGKGKPYDEMTRVFLAMVLFNSRRFEQLLRELAVPGRPYPDYPFEELLYIVRGLLETGQYEEAAEAQLCLESKVATEGSEELYGNLMVCRLIFFAFMGWEEDYFGLLDSGEPVVKGLPEPLKKYWAGFACFNAGQPGKGETLMDEGLQGAAGELPDHWLNWMASRLQGLRENREFIQTGLVPRLAGIRGLRHPDYHRLVRATTEAARPPVLADRATTGMIAAILIVYALTAWLGDIHDMLDLIGFGANSGLLVKKGEWFRLFTYQFLHLGAIHLFMNVIALRFFGPPIETLLGPKVFVGLYLWSGVCGGLATVQAQAGLSVGASAAVAGLLGAALAFELLGDRRQKVFGNQSYLATLVFIIIINLLIGLVEKGIDNSAHVGGFAGGLVAGIVLVVARRRRLWVFATELLAVVFVTGLFGFSSWQFTTLRDTGGYPGVQVRVAGTTPASWPIELGLPEGWKVVAAGRRERVRALQGPLNERIDLVTGANHEPVEDVLKEYLDERTKALTETPEVEFRSRLGPVDKAYGGRTFREIRWRLALEGRKLTQLDLLCFEPGRLLLIQCILPTHHDEAYEPVFQALLGTLKWK